MRDDTPRSSPRRPPALRRTLTLPWLVFYGVGVTVGAGIFALIGEVLRLAGDHAPLAFLLAGLIAAVTGVSYALLVRVFPRAGGEAVFVNRGLGRVWGRVAGFGMVAVGTISSAVVALAFAGYMRALVAVPEELLVGAVILSLAGVAWLGVRESVVLAALVTVLEVGALVVVIGFGVPLLGDLPSVAASFAPPGEAVLLAGVLSGAVLAFFAFIGFEDIVNMAEETVRPARTVPRAILWTIAITVTLYALLAAIAVQAPNRAEIAGSAAPLAVLFEAVSGRAGEGIAGVAALAMVNGILVQIVMASRVLYGMANEGLAPAWFGAVGAWRRTPTRATVTVAACVLTLALLVPLVRLAEWSSLVTLGVFALVNLALVALGRSLDDPLVRRFRWWGALGAALCLGIAGFQILSAVIAPG